MAIPVSDINKTRILREIWLKPGISRIELAAALNLNKSSITKITQELLETRTVLTGDEGVPGPQGGRKPVGLEINRDWGIFGGLEITENRFQLSALDFSGNQLFTIERTHNAGSAGELPEIVNRAAALIAEEADGRRIIGMGIGLPGMVNSRTGELLRSEPLKVESVYPLAEKIAPLPYPLYLDNDANCSCWGELAGKIPSSETSFLYVLGEFRESTSPGIGMGLALNGRVYQGPGYGAGEFKSILGNSGPSDQFSIPRDKLGKISDDPDLRRRMMEELGKNIALIANVLNLDRVILGGFFHSYEEKWLELIEEEIHKNNSYPDTLGKLVYPSLFGSKAVSLGAAYMCVENFLDLSGRFNMKLISKEN